MSGRFNHIRGIAFGIDCRARNTFGAARCYWLRVEHPIFDAEDLAALDVDKQGVVAVAHPYVSVRRVNQSESSIVGQPIVATPEQGRQDLTILPTLSVPTVGLYIGPIVIALIGCPVPLVGLCIEALAVLLPLRRTVARLVGGPIVTMGLRVLRLAVLLVPLLAVLSRLLLAVLLVPLLAVLSRLGLAVLLVPLLAVLLIFWRLVRLLLGSLSAIEFFLLFPLRQLLVRRGLLVGAHDRVRSHCRRASKTRCR